MADLCCQYSYAGIVINNTAAGANRLVLGDDGITGLDGAPIRSQVDPRGQIHGGIVHTKFFAARIITFTGMCHIQSVPVGMTSGYFSALAALQAAVVSALEGQLNSAATLSWTPTGQGARSISCTYGVPGQEIQFAGTMLEPTFSFSLIASSPTIS